LVAQVTQGKQDMPLTWESRAKRFLKAEMKRADVSYQEFADRLQSTV